MNFKMNQMSFKMSEKHIIRMVKKNVDLLIGEKESYSKEDFAIIYAGSLGTEPITSEYQFVFRNTTDISVSTILKFFVDKLATTWDSELKALELFQVLDQKGKYFIDNEDIIEAYKEIDCKLDLKVLLEFFHTVSSDQTLDYFGFKNMFLNYFIND